MPPKAKSKKPVKKQEKTTELILREEGQEYAQVGRMLGNGRLEAICFDGQTRLGHIRGKFRKRVWINAGDVILVALRDFQDNKVDVINKYSSDQVRTLKTMGEIPHNTKINADLAAVSDDEDTIEFRFEDI